MGNIGNITINIEEMHIHMQERTDIHNFYPDGFGGLTERDDSSFDESDTMEEEQSSDKEMEKEQPNDKDLEEEHPSDEEMEAFENILKAVGFSAVEAILGEDRP